MNELPKKTEGFDPVIKENEDGSVEITFNDQTVFIDAEGTLHTKAYGKDVTMHSDGTIEVFDGKNLIHTGQDGKVRASVEIEKVTLDDLGQVKSMNMTEKNGIKEFEFIFNDASKTTVVITDGKSFSVTGTRNTVQFSDDFKTLTIGLPPKENTPTTP